MKYFILILLILSLPKCNSQTKSFNREVTFEVKAGLAIVPVSIEGKEYSFLLDTGAPTAISEELQKQHQFKVTDKKKQKDSSRNTKYINQVALDTLKIGGLRFHGSSVSVYNFNENETIACLGIDGIIGRDFMEACTWKIDFENKKLYLSSERLIENKTTDYKFKKGANSDILIDLKTQKAKITGVKIDYGSNGYLSVPNKIFKVLKERGEFSGIRKNIGLRQGGLFGKVRKEEKHSGILSAVKLGNVILDDFPIETGSNGLLGTGILKYYIVSIDWKSKVIRLEKNDQKELFIFDDFGIGIGYYRNKAMLFYVSEGSTLDSLGIKAGLEVESFGAFNFESHSDYCSYFMRDKNLSEMNQIKFKDKEYPTKISLKRKYFY